MMKWKSDEALSKPWCLSPISVVGESKFCPQRKLFRVEGAKWKAISFPDNAFHRGKYYYYTIVVSDKCHHAAVPQCFNPKRTSAFTAYCA